MLKAVHCSGSLDKQLPAMRFHREISYTVVMHVTVRPLQHAYLDAFHWNNIA